MHTASQTSSQDFSPLLTLLCHYIFTSFYFYIDIIQGILIFLRPITLGNHWTFIPSFERFGVPLAGFLFPLCVVRFRVLYKAYHWIKSAKILLYIIQESKYTPYQRLTFASQRSLVSKSITALANSTNIWTANLSRAKCLATIFWTSRQSLSYVHVTRIVTFKQLTSPLSNFPHLVQPSNIRQTFSTIHILRWWLQLDFHLDLTDLAVRFSRPFSNSLHAASPMQSSFPPILTCLTTNFFFKRTASAIFRKSHNIKELVDRMGNTEQVARVCICST